MGRFRGGAIGVDVDRGAIKAVQLSKGADGHTLQHVGYHRLPEGVIVEGEVADAEVLAREIKAFWDLHSFKGKSVILGVAGRNVIVRFVDFPRLSSEDLDSAMSFHAEEHIPMPLEDAVLDHIVLGPSTENPEEDRVLVVAAHKDMILGYTSAIRSGGLKPTGVDVKALSLTRSALPDVLFDNEETVLLLDVGTEISNLVVVQNGMPTLTQFIPLGFRDFSQAVAEAADIDSDEAEKQALNPRASINPIPEDEEEDGDPRLEAESEAETLSLEPVEQGDERDEERDSDADAGTGPARGDGTREIEGEAESRETSAADGHTGDAEERDPRSQDVEPTVGDSSGMGDERGGSDAADTVEAPDTPHDEARTEELSSDPALMYDVRRGLEDAAGRLAEEVQRSIEYHNSRPDGREVARVLISGEGALVRGLDGYVGSLLGVPTERARPVGKLAANRSNVSDEQLGAMEPVLAIALGLAMEDE
ncbi:MAG: type IV pilus assembly protein PilM [Rubrobacteraceae bacterium]